MIRIYITINTMIQTNQQYYRNTTDITVTVQKYKATGAQRAESARAEHHG